MSSASSTPYCIGMATADITPPVGTPLAGFAARELHGSVGVYRPLRAVATAITDGQEDLLILSAEWIYFGTLAERVRSRVSQATGMDGSRILLAATHTHCGPVLSDVSTERHGWVDHAYVDRAIDNMALAAARATRHRYPARIRFGVGTCAFATCRRKPDPDAPCRVQRAMLPHPDGLSDREVSVLVFETGDGIPRGILFQYACHPTSRGGLLIGGDYPGFAFDVLQEAFEYAQPCFLQGCGADQKPRPADPGAAVFGRRSIEQVRELGMELGHAVVDLVRGDRMKPVEGPIRVRQRVIPLQTEPLDDAQVTAALAEPEDSYRRRWALHHRNRMERGLPEERDVPFEIQTVRFGNALALVVLAAEATVEHGLRMKRDLQKSFTHVLPVAYANNVIGYIPSRRQFSEFGYEVLDANQFRRRTGRFVPETEDQIHDTIQSMLDEDA